VKVGGRASLLIDVVVDAAHLLRRVAEVGCGRFGGDSVVLRPQHQVELRVVQRIIEIFLRLLQAVGVGSRLALQDLPGDTEVPRQRVDLRLVQAGDGLHVSCAVAQLDEETLVVLEAVGRSRHGVVEPVGVVVLEHLPRALLEVRCGNDLEIGARRQPVLALLAARQAHHQLEEVQDLRAERVARKHDLPWHRRLELRHHLAHGLVPRLVAAGRFQDRSDVLHLMADAQLLAERCAVRQALRARVALGKE